MENTLSTTRFHDSIHDEHLQHFEEQLLSSMEIQGKQDGAENSPITREEFLALVHNMLEAAIQSEIHFNHKTHQPLSGMAVAKKIEEQAKVKVTEITSELHDDEQKLHPILKERKQLGDDPQGKLYARLVYGGIWIVAIAEGYFNYYPLRVSSVPTATAYWIAIAIAVVFGFGIPWAAGFIKRASSPWVEVRRWCIVLVPTFLFFALFGNLRAAAYNNVIDINPLESHPTSGSISWWVIALISFFLFAATLAISIRYAKTEEEANNARKIAEKEKEIKKVTDSIQAKQRSIAQIEAMANTEINLAFRRWEAATANEEWLVILAERARNTYIDKNLQYRSDKLCPVFFSTPPKFNFTFFFINTSKNTNQ